MKIKSHGSRELVSRKGAAPTTFVFGFNRDHGKQQDPTMSLTNSDYVLLYLESLISRQSEEIQVLLETKPKPRTAIDRTRFQIENLIKLKNAYLTGDPSKSAEIARLKNESMIFAS